MERFRTRGTCAAEIQFEVEGDILKSVKFIGGCRGNTTGVSKLVEGMHIDDVISKIQGTDCRGGTSCPDQLAQALIQYKEKHSL